MYFATLYNTIKSFYVSDTVLMICSGITFFKIAVECKNLYLTSTNKADTSTCLLRTSFTSFFKSSKLGKNCFKTEFK